MFWTNAPVERLVRENDAVTGAVVKTADGEVIVTARRGVVLAAGGFPQDMKRRRSMFPHDRDNTGHHSPAPKTNTGDGLRLGEDVGAIAEKGYPNAAAWVPVSRVPRRDGS